MDRSQGRFVNFRLLYLITQLVGFSLIILVVSWIGLHLNGATWDFNKPSLLFNWHPILMMIGMVVLYGNSILIYRGFRYGRKKNLKLTHAIIHGLAFLFTVFGLIAAFGSHNYAKVPIPNLYSLHSWMGLSAVILFSLQYVVGFVCFLFPMAKEPIRVVVMPMHVFFGLVGFVMSIASTLMGISEKAFFAMPDGKYGEFPNQALLVNCLGMLTAIYGALVVYVVTEPNYKREPLAEDTMLLTGNSE